VRGERLGVGVELVEDEAVLVAVDGADVEPETARLVADRRLRVRGHAGEELLAPAGPHRQLHHQAEHPPSSVSS
jgi:hypothetical protein